MIDLESVPSKADRGFKALFPGELAVFIVEVLQAFKFTRDTTDVTLV